MHHIHQGIRRGGILGGVETLRLRHQGAMGGEAVVTWMLQRQAGERVVYLRRLLDGLDVIVVHNFGSAGAGTIPTQLFQLETLPVFATHVHQQTVIRNAEQTTSLRRGKLLLPDMLQS